MASLRDFSVKISAAKQALAKLIAISHRNSISLLRRKILKSLFYGRFPQNSHAF
jgi:hypothetical protein